MALQSIDPQRPVNGALRFLPAWQFFEIRDPALEVRMILDRQALRFMYMHRRRDRDVGDRHRVADEPFRFRQTPVKDAGQPVPVGRLLFDDCFVRLVFNSGLTTYSTR